MREIIIVFILSLIFLTTSPVRANSSSHLYKDADFTQSTNQFSQNEKVYVKIVTSNSGNKERVARLLDADKNEVQKINLNRSESSPFTYTGILSVPGQDGVFYVDVRIIDSSSSTFASQENINVGKGGSSANVSVNSSVKSSSTSRTEVSSSSNTSVNIEGTGEVIVEPSEIPKMENQTIKPEPIFSQIDQFFTTLFEKLTNLF